MICMYMYMYIYIYMYMYIWHTIDTNVSTKINVLQLNMVFPDQKNSTGMVRITSERLWPAIFNDVWVGHVRVMRFLVLFLSGRMLLCILHYVRFLSHIHVPHGIFLIYRYGGVAKWEIPTSPNVSIQSHGPVINDLDHRCGYTPSIYPSIHPSIHLSISISISMCVINYRHKW